MFFSIFISLLLLHFILYCQEHTSHPASSQLLQIDKKSTPLTNNLVLFYLTHIFIRNNIITIY
jgi:hypothetical protein